MKKYAHVFVLAALILFITQPVFADFLTFSGAEDRSVEATDSSGAIVTFDVTAENASSTSFAVSCSPESGSLFSVGTTTVQCEAVDSASATSTTSFDVGVFEIATSTETRLDIEGDVDVPAECDVVDTDGVAHHFPASSSPSVYLGICAVAAALESDLISDADFSNQFPSIGLFITAINDVAADPSSEYWALYLNDTFADCGLGCLPVAAGDEIKLQLEDFSGNNLGDSLTLHISSLIATSTATSTDSSTDNPSTDSTHSTSSVQASSPQAHSGSSSGGGSSSHDQFNVESALSYLASVQLEGGSFSSSMLTDWAAIAFASVGNSSAKTKLRDYLRTASPSLSHVTDYERHAMALQALGINPYTGTAQDYIAPITGAFDGTQIGDTSLDNDDIFAIFPLMHAGYTTNDEIIQKTSAFIVARQKTDGSWDESVDVTAAAIQALSLTSSLPGVPDAIVEGKAYLHEEQREDGGWENSFSTSWALQAIAALDESESSWTPGNDTPEEFLASLQQSDGGVDSMSTSDTMRTWATAYAIPAARQKTWDDVLASFKKPIGATDPATNASQNATSTSLTATTTLVIATTTPLVLGASTSTVSAASSTPTIPPAAPKPQPVPKKIAEQTDAIHSSQATLTAETNPQAQVATVAAVQEEKLSFFARIWNFLVGLFAW